MLPLNRQGKYMSAAVARDTDEQELGALVDYLAVLEDRREALDRERDQIRARIASFLAPGERFTAPSGLTVGLTKPSYRFNPSTALRVLAGTEWLHNVLRPMPDKELCKRYVPDKLYIACCTVVEPTVRRVTQ